MHLRVRRFLVQILQQQQRTARLRVIQHTAQAIEARLHPLLDIRGEMEAGVNHDPIGAQHGGGVDIGAEIGVGGLAQQRRILADIDRRGCVQANPHARLFGRRTDGAGARGVDPAERVVAGIELDIDVTHPMIGGPGDRILDPKLASDIDPDPVAQGGFGHVRLRHGWVPPKRRNTARYVFILPQESAMILIHHENIPSHQAARRH